MMGLLASLFFGFVPMLIFAGFINWLDRYEKEPRLLLGAVFTWGAVVAAGAAFVINTVLGISIYAITGSETAAELTSGSIIAPIVEESLKGFAVLLVFLIARHEFDSVLDGMVYAGITALGFAATENTYYIYTYGYQEGGWSGLFTLVFVRVILVGWQHPAYTALIGIGLAVARANRSWAVKIAAPLLGWAAAIFTHALHNTIASFASGAGALIGFFVDWSGWFLLFIFVVVMILREKMWLGEYLKDEVSLGTLTSPQYEAACSATKNFLAGLTVFGSPKYQRTRRFYQLCAELAHKKRQLSRFGEEGGNSVIIGRLRSELAQLSSDAAA
jgi:RsiW-degrading membrane proteinase PrsW (M82 family)